MRGFLLVLIITLLVAGCKQRQVDSIPVFNESASSKKTKIKLPEPLKLYYKNIDLDIDGDKLYDELAGHTIGKHSEFLSYGQRHNFLYDVDEDPTNTHNVILMYSGESRSEKEYLSGRNKYKPQTFNTEHIYPQSLINNTAKGDLHHLRACDQKINFKRANYKFVEGKGNYKLIGRNLWYPGDQWKGDVARMIMYLSLRYNESFKDVGNLDLFLKWNSEDKVSEFETQRNNRIEKIQGNRNPFIDNPYLATLIWGGNPAENKWK